MAGDICSDVAVIVDPDAATLDALAQLALDVRRAGGRIRLSRASPGLRGLVALAGLAIAAYPLDRRLRPCCGAQADARRGGDQPCSQTTDHPMHSPIDSDHI